jgi:hypothetical protein
MSAFIGRPDAIVSGVIIRPDLVYQDPNNTGGVIVVTKLFHGFSIDENSNLIYSTSNDNTITLQDQNGSDIYEDVDMGTNEYAYSLDEDGNLIVTYNY